MKFISPLIAVSDMERSKSFYKDIFGLNVEVDFGANVTLTGGLSLQTLETWEGFIGGIDVRFGGNDKELYFEEDDFDGFIEKIGKIEKIKSAVGVEYVHQPLEHSWGQRVVRIYDPDRHIIEIGENMTAVVRRFQASGMSIAEIAVRMGVREEYVQDWLL